MTTITSQMIRDLLHFGGPMSYGDLLTFTKDSTDIANLTAAIDAGLARDQFRMKVVAVQGFDAEIFYTGWKE